MFGIPGEETLDLNESLSRSSIEFVPVRHEQGGAYMADVYGRLTGHAGVCLGTLGPGALNLVTAVADAFLDRAPLVALTGQGDLERMHKESHQYIDLLRVMRPITKWNARLSDPAIIPEVVRKAFKVAEAEKPGATHIELPEDVMAAEIESEPLPRRRQARPEPAGARAAEGGRPRARRDQPGGARGQRRDPRRRGAGAARVRARDRHPGGRDVHGQGPASAGQPEGARRGRAPGGRLPMAGFDDADVVLAIGYDLVEHSPEHWNPRRDKTIICIDSVPAEIDAVLHARGRARRRHLPHPRPPRRGVPARAPPGRVDASCATWCSGASSRPRTTTHFPMQPPRALFEIREALGREDILISDVGLHKLWIGRMFPAYEPEHRADRERPRGHGLRGARRRSPPSSCTRTATS